MKRQQLVELMKRMEENSIAIIPSSREITRSHDSNFRFRQDSDFFYLTGFDEPDSVAVIVPSHKKHPYTLFVRPRNKEREIWDGPRAGVEGVLNGYGADAAFPIEKFEKEVLKLLSGPTKLYYRFGVHRDIDHILLNYFHKARIMGRKKAFLAPHTIIDPSTIIHEMRLIKTDEEIALMQRAADIAAEAHIEAMKKTKPGMNEFEVEAIVEYVFRRRGAGGPAYTSIIGGGANATILHYINNNAPLKDGDLLLIDAGCEYKGYASDITRTFPVNGKFTKAQREVYQVVLDVQKACVEITKPGVSNEERQKTAIDLLTDGMLKLGLLKGNKKELIRKKEYMKFYMHGLGHYLGLDVHDLGSYYGGKNRTDPRKFEPGMVLTVEPGLYIAPDAKDIPDKYRGIGIRIEDDVLVTEDGQRVLTHKVPKEIDEIEALMAKKKK
jgi:Xaa-Pro aminopeptidase